MTGSFADDWLYGIFYASPQPQWVESDTEVLLVGVKTETGDNGSFVRQHSDTRNIITTSQDMVLELTQCLEICSEGRKQRASDSNQS